MPEKHSPQASDVRWGAKGKKIVKGKDGSEKRVEYFYGYEDQISLDAQAELVTSAAFGRGDNRHH